MGCQLKWKLHIDYMLEFKRKHFYVFKHIRDLFVEKNLGTSLLYK